MSPTSAHGPARGNARQRAEVESPKLEDALDALRDALRPSDILTALQAIGLDSRDLAEGIGADERTVRRWLGGQDPTRNHEQTIGMLRVLAIHILQRRGLPVDLVARWLRLPDSELRFQTPLAAVADNRLDDVIVAFDEYVAPRPGTALRELSKDAADGTVPVDENAGRHEDDEQPTGDFRAVFVK